MLQIEKKQREKTDKLRKKVKAIRARKEELEQQHSDTLQNEMNVILKACVDRVNLIQREDLDLYERRKLAIEFKEFVDKYVNPEYREHFYAFINEILNKYRVAAQQEQVKEYKTEWDNVGGNEGVQWPLNCTHIKIAYSIWRSKKCEFSNPLEIAHLYRRYYYEAMMEEHNENTETAHKEIENLMRTPEAIYNKNDARTIDDGRGLHECEQSKDNQPEQGLEHQRQGFENGESK